MTGNPYHSRRYLDEYLLFHYGQGGELCPGVPRELLNFHRRVRDECLLPVSFAGPTRALDLGCAVGRFTFELASVVDKALGVDNSPPFIRAARRMAKTHTSIVQMKETGAQFRSVVLTLSKALRSGKVEFRVADAQDWVERAGPSSPGRGGGAFHVVAALNLLCRLPRPRQFLAQLHHLVVPRGQLIIASPYSWLSEYTPKREWLASDQVEEILRPHFRLARRRELPFVLREHRRKYQLVIPEVSVFRRR